MVKHASTWPVHDFSLIKILNNNPILIINLPQVAQKLELADKQTMHIQI